MSEETAIDIEASTVYVTLLDEGTDVWRPVQALSLGDRKFVLLCPHDYDAAEEKWQYIPGSIVQCEERQDGDEQIQVVVDRVEV